jgi:hypothetical protein
MSDEQNSQAARPQAAALLSATDCDVLYGVRTIAAWLGMTPGACRARIADGTIPVFRPPGVKVLCALKTTLNCTWAQYEARSRKKTLAP